MSKIIRNVTKAPEVYIGEYHQETKQEKVAEKLLQTFFPFVNFVTTPDGLKLIPIQETSKFQEHTLKLQKTAKEEGFAEGFEEGMHKGQEEARRIVKQLENAIKDAINQRELLLQEAKSEVLELVLQVAKKVTFNAIEVDREVTSRLIFNVIDQLIDRSSLKIKVHPDYLPILEQQVDRFLEGSTSIKELEFESDPRVKFGGCFIETPSGDIDARLDSQFEIIKEALFNEEVEE